MTPFKKIQSKTTAVLHNLKAIKICIVIVFFIAVLGILLLQQNSTSKKGDYLTVALLQQQPTAISWQYQGTQYDLLYQDDSWQCPQLAQYPVDQKKALALALALQELKSRDKVADDSSLAAAYGLTQPLTTITATNETGDSYTCSLGEKDGAYYLSVAEGDGIYVADKTLAASLQTDMGALLQPMQLCTVNPASINSFSVEQSGATLQFVFYPHSLPEEVYSIAFTWFTQDSAGGHQAADSINTEAFLKQLTELTAAYMLPVTQASTVDLATYGLAQPWAKINLGYQEAVSGDNGQSTETIQNKTAVISIGGQTEDGDYYVCSQPEGAIGILDADTVRQIISTKRADFVPQDICLIELSGVNKLSLNYQGQSTTFTRVEQVDEAASQGTQAVLAITYTKNGQEIDQMAFEDCYAQLVSMRAAGLAEQAGGEAIASLTFTRNSSRNYPSMTLRFLSYDDQNYLVDFNDSQSLLADKQTVDRFLSTLAQL